MSKTDYKRHQEFEQLINDIAEDMPLNRWKKNDFAECITWILDDRDKLNRKYWSMRDKLMQLSLGKGEE